MFHFVLGKILACQTGLAFDPPPEFIDINGNPVKWSGKPFFVMQTTEGERYPEAECFQFGARYWYDFSLLPKNRPIHICYGHWCRYELYRDWKTQIREDWLKIPEDRFVETDPEAVYIHVRLTDFKVDSVTAQHQGQTTPIDGFAACLERLSDFKRLVIVTDDAKDSFHEGFKRLGIPYEVQSNNRDQDFLALASCRQMIMSASTFSWWAGFLGRAEKIVCPLVYDTMWERGQRPDADKEEYINLYVDDEPDRWLFINVPAS